MRDLLPFLKLYKRHWFGLTLGMALAFLTLCFSIGLLTLSGWFLSAAAVAGLTVAKDTFNYMLPSAFVRGFAMGRTAGRWGERVTSHNATFKVLADLRTFFFDRLAPLIPGKVANVRDADLLNRLVADVDAMDHVYLRLISPIIVGLLGIVSLTLYFCWFDLTIGLTLGGILLLLLLCWPILFYRLGKRNGIELTEHKAKFRIALMDWLQGFSELTLFGAEPDYRHQIALEEKTLIARQYINAHLTGLAQSLLMLSSGLTLILMLWLAGDGVEKTIQDPLIAMVIFGTMASFEMLMPIAGAFQHLGQTISSAHRLNEVLETQPDVVFPSQTMDPVTHTDIRFEQVQFGYTERQTVINDLTLTIDQGQKVAIVGQTGSGKSTLIQLLSRYWDPNTGHISIGDRPLTQWNEAQLRHTISTVSQRVDILNGTLRDNLMIAREEADDETLAQILQEVGLEKLLEEPGLNAWLGDGGRQLSGGEKRRIGIARALLHDGQILVLDEPTEGLDKQTEHQILSVLKRHFTHKTVIFITHRLVMMEDMDSICVLEKGQIVEQGAHSALMAQQGRYHQLYQTL